MALLCAANGRLELGAWLIFAAMFCDLFDGKVARMTKTDGEFGVQLDSWLTSFHLVLRRRSRASLRIGCRYLGEGEHIVWAMLFGMRCFAID